MGGRRAFRIGRGLAFNIQIDLTLATAERLFFAWIIANWRMLVLYKDLMGEHDQFFGATTIGVDVGDELESNGLDLAKATIGNLNGCLLGRRQDNAGTR
jgi:hypothetical protein